MNVTYYNDGTDSKGHYLESTVENEYGDVVSQKKVYYPLVKFESHQKLYFLQYNDKMELIYEVCNYLNYYINESSEQTRDFKAKTLRNYLCFMALGGFDYTDLTDQYVLERIYSFFRGDDFRSAQKDYRSRQTVNNYISVIRDFARYLNKPSSILKRTSYIQSGYREDGMTSLPKIYPSSMRNNPHANDLIKPYISPQEYTVLKKLAIAKNDTQAVLLFHLMYFYGLRIGECLGLTEEDFIIRQQHYNPSPTITSKAVTGGTWRLPSIKDWQYMFIGCGSDESYSDPTPTAHMTKSYSGLKDKLSAAGGTALKIDGYWSSTESQPGVRAWFLSFDSSNAMFLTSFENIDFLDLFYVRACLAF